MPVAAPPGESGRRGPRCGAAAWANLTSPGCCPYDNGANERTAACGMLYNWYAVNTRTLAPAGWHVPSDAEWRALVSHLGAEAVAGGKLKAAGADQWKSPNVKAINASGFTALGCGYRTNIGSFTDAGERGYGWSATAFDGRYAWIRSMARDRASVSRATSDNQAGFNVRCVRD